MSLGYRVLLILLVSVTTGCAAPTPGRRVLVVYDRNSSESKDVATHYLHARNIPKGNLCEVSIKEPGSRVVPFHDYVSDFRDPIRQCLNRAGREQILYLVLAYVRPHTISIPETRMKYYAVDSYLADIWDLYSTGNFDPLPSTPHPYYANNRARDNVFLPFTPFAEMRGKPDATLLYGVWRLDGATSTIAKSLVDKALRAEAGQGPRGQACIDERMDPLTFPDEGYRAGDWDLYRAAQFLTKAGFHVIEDNMDTEFGTPPSTTCPNAALYAGWYKLNHYNDAFVWNDGAIGFHMDSLSAMDARAGENWSANALKKGITVTSGAVNEPYLAGLPRPGGIFHDLLAGSNVGDALLRNTRYMKWMIVNFGDPLYTPFAGGRQGGHK